jgi:hypothetical protein
MRDMAQLLGSFEVSRIGFLNALNKVGAVMLVPGGQTEMMFSRSENLEIQLSTKHKVVPFCNFYIKNPVLSGCFVTNIACKNRALSSCQWRRRRKIHRGLSSSCPFTVLAKRRFGWMCCF